MASSVHQFVLSAIRTSTNRVNLEKVKSIVQETLKDTASVLGKWKIEFLFPEDHEPIKGGWKCTFDIKVTSIPGEDDHIFKCFRRFETDFNEALSKKQAQNWVVKTTQFPVDYPAFIDSLKAEVVDGEKKKDLRIDFDTTDVVLEPGERFSHLFGLKDQISTAFSSINTALKSKMRNRYHIAAYGPPGCGKTDMTLSICQLLKDTFGEDAVVQLDGTSLTEAGVAKLLDDAKHNPLVIMIEEIEKTNPDNLRWLLGLLDKRGQINRVNFHRKVNIQMNTLCICTVNNIKMFKAMHGGAIASRFPNKIYFPRPNRDTLKLILKREVTLFGGKVEWIEPTLKFCVDELNINDPREIVPICISGGDDLLDGSYQEQLRNVRMNAERELELNQFCG